MKKSNISYDDIVDYNKIYSCYKDIIKNTKHKDKLLRYNLFLGTNLLEIYNELKNKTYNHGKYNIFLIKDPKYRIIMSENLKDKIVNHLVYRYILKEELDKRLIDSNCATRENKGGSYAFKLCKRYFNELKKNNEEFYILKFDIKKYFYNIDQDILINKLESIYKDKYIINLLKNIIYSTNYSYVNKQINNIILDEINKSKSINQTSELKNIPRYNYHKGLSIGNVTSQIFAIFYLNELDHFIKEKLGCNYYIRYMDDGIILDYSKERLKKIRNEIENKLISLGLVLNKKTNIYKASSGFTFIGYRFVLKNKKQLIRITNQNKYKIKRKINYLDKNDKNKLKRVKASYYGYLKVASTNYLQYKLKID